MDQDVLKKEHLLDRLVLPEQLSALSPEQLEQLAAEIRDLIIQTVACNGGHLASNLGVVELTMALLLEFDLKHDQVVFDVGHQCYTWKILTGRLNRFCTLRKKDGLSGFPKTCESLFDCFNTGHSSTSISAALGITRAFDRLGKAGRAIAVIGDGALTGGMAFEALNDAGQSHENLLVILNDNQMSISRNVGGLSRHLENLRISPRYIKLKSGVDAVLLKTPVIGRPIYKLLQWFKLFARQSVQQQSIFFEQLGFRYYGPVDGHDLASLRQHLRTIRQFEGPILLHVLTQKGKGYSFAEESPDVYHGVAPFVVENGVANGTKGRCTFSAEFGRTLTGLAAFNPAICAISAAMTSGTGLNDFVRQFPARLFDVGIAEQHAVTLAAGLAAGGMRPVVALYSTFLQRAYDQLLHDICLQKLPVVLAIDRAGMVGEDGETHQGIFDLGLLLPLPNLEVICPVDCRNLSLALAHAFEADHPVAIRYPRGSEWPEPLPPDQSLGTSLLRGGNDLAIVALGVMTGPALKAAELLAETGVETSVLSVVRAKPVELAPILTAAAETRHVLIIEEAAETGGFGQMILPEIIKLCPDVRTSILAIDVSRISQGSRSQLLAEQGLSPEGIAAAAKILLK